MINTPGLGVLVLSGPPCAGKSSMGRALAREMPSEWPRSVYIEVDQLVDLLLPTSDRSRPDRMLAYDGAHALTRLLVERGSSVVLECTYARAEQRMSLVRALKDMPAVPVWVVECFISREDAIQRFKQRSQITDLDEDSLGERVERFPYSDQAKRLTWFGRAPAVLAGEVAAWLGTQPSPIKRISWAEAGRPWN